MRNRYLALFAMVLLCLAAAPALADTVDETPEFIRGDVNADGLVNDADSLALFNELFMTGGDIRCELATDVDDNGIAGNLADYMYLAAYVRGTGSAPPAPFPNCGEDPTSPVPGSNCCSPRRTPTVTPVGTFVLIFMLMGAATWVLWRRKMATSH